MAWNKTTKILGEFFSMTINQKAIEQRLRRKLQAQGYVLHKSRKAESIDNFGGYMICDMYTSFIVRGSRFELDLDDVAQFVDE